MNVTQTVAVSLGVFFVLLLLGLVFWRRNLTSAEYTFSRVVLALAAACIAVVITGFLQVNINEFIQAGGALAVFVIVFFYSPAALQGTNEWQNIRLIWRNLRDIHDNPEQSNQDDIAVGLNAINETARLIDNDTSLLAPFKTDYGEDYCRLYQKLFNNRYPIQQVGSTSDIQLTLLSRKLAGDLSCTP